LSGGRLGSLRTVCSRSRSLEHRLTAMPDNIEIHCFVEVFHDENFTKNHSKFQLKFREIYAYTKKPNNKYVKQF